MAVAGLAGSARSPILFQVRPLGDRICFEYNSGMLGSTQLVGVKR